jgi:hypothetical protein
MRARLPGKGSIHDVIIEMVPWFQRFIFINFIAKGRGKINLWNQGIEMVYSCTNHAPLGSWHSI